MINHKHHKFFIGIASIIILVIGLTLGVFLTVNLGLLEIQVINLGLSLSSIIILLLIGGLVLDIREVLVAKKNKK